MSNIQISNRSELINLMKSHYQDKNAKQTILHHGISVWLHFKELYSYLGSEQQNYQYPIPSWLEMHRVHLFATLRDNLENIKKYLIFHDCGKPLCCTEDEKGQHFKNHAEVSKKLYAEIFGVSQISELIGDDMLCHTTKPKDFEILLGNPNINILLCAALSELHSNAKMFGGFDSDSFKIKFKNLEKLGKRILENQMETIND